MPQITYYTKVLQASIKLSNLHKNKIISYECWNAKHDNLMEILRKIENAEHMATIAISEINELKGSPT